MLEDEVLGKRADGLRFAKHQRATAPQREGKELKRPPLELGGEVDEHIAAEHDIDARKGRAVSEIVLSKDDQTADRLAHLEGAVDAREMAVDQLRCEPL